MAGTEWLTDSEQRAWRALQFMQMQLEAALNRQLMADSEMSLSDYVVLVRLTDQPDGRLRLFQLGQEIGWEQSRLSHHVTRMAKRGLLRKESCDSDRRGAFVVITDQGRGAIEAAAPLHVATVRRLFIDLLDAEQIEMIGETAETVIAALNRPSTPT
jgi:DNA-binding MarR family transcriptional regulator